MGIETTIEQFYYNIGEKFADLKIIAYITNFKKQVSYDLSYEEITEKARSEQKRFCLVLSEGSCPSCEHFLQLLSGRVTSQKRSLL